MNSLGVIRQCRAANQQAGTCALAAFECTATCSDGSTAICSAGSNTPGSVSTAAVCTLVAGENSAFQAAQLAAGQPAGNPRLGAKVQAQCSGGLTPTCPVGGTVSCICSRAMDQDPSSVWPCGPGGGGPPGAPASSLTVRFLDPATYAPTTMEISRIDISLTLGESVPSFSGLADTLKLDRIAADNVSAGNITLDFVDGSTQVISLASVAASKSAAGGDATEAVGSLGPQTWKQVFYIPPVVSSYVGIRFSMLPEGSPVKVFGVADIDVYGRPLRSMDEGAVVDLLGTQDGRDPSTGPWHVCPATTYQAKAAASAGGVGSGAGYCAPCPYPSGSASGADGADKCFCPICGDSKVFWQVGERCDDGNLVPGDGCDGQCNIEEGYRCLGPATSTGYGNPVASYETKDVCLSNGAAWYVIRVMKSNMIAMMKLAR
mmetsp:Transcript_36802/g.97698  ORF Transcript_36802/g.97698 Transcript_36802/m.97698 type:complete len:432 (-) Transcript_36802:2032-3327(-)